MIRAEVQGVEVVPLGFGFWAIGNLVAHGNEDVGHPLLDGGQRVAGADGVAVVGHGDVHDSSISTRASRSLFEHLLALGKGLLDPATRCTDAFARVSLGRSAAGHRFLGWPEPAGTYRLRG